jgi:integrase
MSVTPGKFRATVKVRGQQREKEFPLGTSDRVVQDWKDRARGKLKDERPPTTRGTFAADVERYLPTLADRYDLQKERTRQLDWWSLRFGRMKRATIEPAQIQAELAELRLTHAASTCNHYRIALSHLWRTLDGKNKPNPLRDVATYEEPEPEPRNLSPLTVRLVLEAWPDWGEAKKGEKRTRVNLAKRVLTVMLRTGLTPADLKRLQRRDLAQLAVGSIYVRRRMKGKGVVGSMFPLDADGIAALTAFRDAGLVGRRFSTHAIYKGWVKTCRRLLERGDLDPVVRDELERARPYDFRHTYGTFVLERTQNLKTTQELLRHRSGKMTKRYAAAMVLPHLRAAVDRLGPMADRLGLPSHDDGNQLEE